MAAIIENYHRFGQVLPDTMKSGYARVKHGALTQQQLNDKRMQDAQHRQVSTQSFASYASM